MIFANNRQRSSLRFFAAAALSLCLGVPAYAISADEVFDDPDAYRQWQWNTNLYGTNVAEVWKKGITGSGVVIGITGQYTDPFHEDLNVSPYNRASSSYATNIDYSDGLSYIFYGGGKRPEQGEILYPEKSHETAGAGMAAAIGGNGKGVVGAAPSATVAGLAGFGAQTRWWASGVDQYSGKFRERTRIDVKNFYESSFYRTTTFSEDALAITATAANNIVYTCSAYNSRAYSGHEYGFPSNCGWLAEGNHRSVINVAAYEQTGDYADFSDYGANVFVTAPGKSTYSTSRDGNGNPAYGYFGGTSAAAPLTAGVIALGKQVFGDMDSRWAKHALAYSSGHGERPNIDPDAARTEWYEADAPTGFWQKNNGGYWFNNNYGFGKVDAVGFVEQVERILYTTSETLFTATDITATETSDDGGKLYARTFTVGTRDAYGNAGLTQNIETVSVSVRFSEEARQNLDLSTLKVTLIAPDDKTSIVVQGSVGDNSTTAAENSMDGFTFLSNAFWGSNYSENKDWKVKVEYDGNGTDAAGGVWVNEVKFSQGNVVFETAGTTKISRAVNVHAVAADQATTVLEISAKVGVEDCVVVNAGVLRILKEGFVGTYDPTISSGETDAFYQSKGARFEQNGGTVEFFGGAEFLRGMVLNGGELSLCGEQVFAGNELTLSGGSFVVATNFDLSGLTFTLSSEAKFSVAEGGKVDFSGIEKFILSYAAPTSEPQSFFSFGDWGEGEIVGLDKLDKSRISFFLNGEEVAQQDGWDFYFRGNTFGYGILIPEPSAFGLLAGTLALALAGTRRRRRAATSAAAPAPASKPKALGSGIGVPMIS